MGVADDIRQLATEFGGRPYRVFLVWTGWTADEDADGRVNFAESQLERADTGERKFQIWTKLGQKIFLTTEGVGRPVLIREVEILPTPRIQTMAGIAEQTRVEGVTESGGVTVDQISASFSEDVLMGLLPEIRHPSFPETLRPGISFFWEIREERPARYRNPLTAGADLPTDLASARARFHVVGKPTLDRFAFQWSVALTRADGERGRNGEVSEVG